MSNIDLDDWDDLDFGNFDSDFGMEPPDPEGRKPVKQVLAGAVEHLKDPETQQKWLWRIAKAAIPESYLPLFEGGKELSEFASDAIDIAKKELDGPAKDFKDTLLNNADTLLGFLGAERVEKIKATLATESEDERAVAKAASAINAANTEMSSTISAIFDKDRVVTEAKAALDVDTSEASMRLASVIGGKQIDVLGVIASHTGGLLAYQNTVHNETARKSLELQFKHYFTARSTEDLIRATGMDMMTALKAISHNTSLPEYSKVRLSESYIQTARENLFGRISDGPAGYAAGIAGRFKESMSNKLSQMLATAKSALGDSSELVRAFAVGKSSLDSAGADVRNQMAGSEGAQFIGDSVSDAVGKNAGAIARANAAFAEYGEKISLYSENPDAVIDGIANKYRDVPFIGGWLRAIQTAGGERIDYAQNIAEKGTEKFDYTRYADRAIVDIIPGYLSRILQEVTEIKTGVNAPRLVYNDKTEKLESIDDVAKTASSDVQGRQAEYRARNLSEMINLIDREEVLKGDVRKDVGRVILRMSDQKGIFNADTFLDMLRELEDGDKIADALERNFTNSYGQTRRLTKMLNDVRTNKESTQKNINRMREAGNGDVLRQSGIIKADEDGKYSVDDEVLNNTITNKLSEEGKYEKPLWMIAEEREAEEANKESLIKRQTRKVKVGMKRKRLLKDRAKRDGTYQNSRIDDFTDVIATGKAKVTKAVSETVDTAVTAAKEKADAALKATYKRTTGSEDTPERVKQLKATAEAAGRKSKEIKDDLYYWDLAGLDSGIRYRRSAVAGSDASGTDSSRDDVLNTMANLARGRKEKRTGNETGEEGASGDSQRGRQRGRRRGRGRSEPRQDGTQYIELVDVNKQQLTVLERIAAKFEEWMSGKPKDSSPQDNEDRLPPVEVIPPVDDEPEDTPDESPRVEFDYVKLKNALFMDRRDIDSSDSAIPAHILWEDGRNDEPLMDDTATILARLTDLTEAGFDSQVALLTLISENTAPKEQGERFKRIRALGNLIGRTSKGYFSGMSKLTRALGAGGGSIIGGVLRGAGSGLGNIISAAAGRSSPDIYVKGEKEPKLYSSDIKRGKYIDEKSNKVVKNIDDITGPVIDEDGNFVVSQEDYDHGLTAHGGSRMSTMLTVGGNLFRTATRPFALAGALNRTGLKAIKKSASWLMGDGVYDVYVGGEGSPRLSKLIMSNGGYFNAKGKVIDKPSKIDGPVFDNMGNMVLTKEDIEKGLFTASGKKIGSSRLMTGLSKLASLAGKTIVGGIRMAHESIMSGTKFFGDVAKGAGSVVGGVLGGVFGRRDGIDTAAGETIDKIYAYMQERWPMDGTLPTPDPVDPVGASSDSDGDGDRDGSWQDMKAKALENKDKDVATDGKDKEAEKDGKGGLWAMLMTIPGILTSGFAMLAKVLGFKAAAGLGMDALDALGDGPNRNGGGRGRGPKPKGRFGRMMGGAKNLFGAGSSRVATAGRAVASSAGTAARATAGAARSGATFAANKIGQTAAAQVAKKGAMAIAAKGAMTAGGTVAAIVGAPVVATALAIGGAAYTLYQVGSFFSSRADAEELERLRFMQYGIDVSSGAALSRIRELEDIVIDATEIVGGKAVIDLDLMKMLEDHGDDIGVDLNNPESVNNFFVWYRDRFIPIYIVHIGTLSDIDKSVDLDDVDDEIDKDDIPKYINYVTSLSRLAKTGSSPYDVTNNPFSDVEMVTPTKEQIETYIRVLKEKYKIKDSGELDIAIMGGPMIGRPDANGNIDLPKINGQRYRVDAPRVSGFSNNKGIDIQAPGFVKPVADKVIDGGLPASSSKVTTSGDYLTPTDGRISSPFGSRIHPITKERKGHGGIDYAAPAGTPVYAANGGVVMRQYRSDSYGNVIYISHPDGKQTRYAHLQGFAGQREGQDVTKGQLIGYVGNTGHSAGNHLHFEVREGHEQTSKAIDPLTVLEKKNKEQVTKIETAVKEEVKASTAASTIEGVDTFQPPAVTPTPAAVEEAKPKIVTASTPTVAKPDYAETTAKSSGEAAKQLSTMLDSMTTEANRAYAQRQELIASSKRIEEILKGLNMESTVARNTPPKQKSATPGQSEIKPVIDLSS